MTSIWRKRLGVLLPFAGFFFALFVWMDEPALAAAWLFYILSAWCWHVERVESLRRRGEP